MATARNNKSMMIAAALLMGLCLCASVVSGQGMAPEPSAAPPEVPSPASDDCLNKLLNMSDCLSYVTADSNVTVPDKPCCPELAGLVDSSPICLCELLGKSDSYGIKINMTRALKLPSMCGVPTPPVQTCSAIGIPVASPTGSEESSTSPGGQAPEGLTASPSTGKNEGTSSSPSSVLTILAGLAFAFLPSFF